MPFLGKTPQQFVDPEVDIDGGSIDGTAIGATSASTATVTTFTSTGIDDNATSTAITIESGGNVGIGTTNPSVIGGGADLAVTKSGGARFILNNSSRQWAIRGDTGADDLRITARGSNDTVDVDYLTVTSTGNVGIGTNSPSSNLHVYNGADAEEQVIIAEVSGGYSNGAGVSLRRDGTEMGRINADYFDGMTFHATTGSGGAATERMRIDSSGNVGIGKTPVAQLDVANGTTYTASGDFLARIQQNTNATGKNGLSVMNAWASTASTMFECAMGWDGSSVGYYPVFKIDGLGQAIFSPQQSEAMRLDASGNLLVGTTSFGGFKQKVVQSTNLGICALHNTLTSGLTYDQLQVLTDHGSSTNFNLIRCYVSGGLNVQFAVRGDGVVFAQSTAIQSLSDARVKENVRDSEQGLDVITALRPVRFDFKEGFGNDQKNQLGFIAQEVEAVFPDAVMEAPEKTERGEPLKSLGPAALIPVMVKAIQEQQAIIEDLQTRLSALEAN